MRLIAQVLAEIAGMFVSDAALTLSVLLLVGFAAAMAWSGLATGALVGGFLVLGSVGVLLGAVWRAGRRT